jgi:hypothetical protein
MCHHYDKDDCLLNLLQLPLPLRLPHDPSTTLPRLLKAPHDPLFLPHALSLQLGECLIIYILLDSFPSLTLSSLHRTSHSFECTLHHHSCPRALLHRRSPHWATIRHHMSSSRPFCAKLCCSVSDWYVEVRDAEAGRIIVLPTTFPGGAHGVQARCFDAMTL